jgi:two-component system chemotaxis response regulator CheB
VVYGMPAAAAQTGLCKAILPLPEIGALIRRLAG